LLGRQENFLDALRVIDPRIRSVEVLVRDSQSGLHLDVNGRLTPLSFFGEGMAAAAEIISLIYSKDVRVVLIDEIENGIHYSALQPLWQHIKLAAKASGTQVIATTHSRECLAAAQAAFAEDAKGVLGLLRLSRAPGDSDDVLVTPYNMEEIESALDLNLDIR
jgi:AAA15 family ATPase/GTPase